MTRFLIGNNSVYFFKMAGKSVWKKLKQQKISFLTVNSRMNMKLLINIASGNEQLRNDLFAHFQSPYLKITYILKT